MEPWTQKRILILGMTYPSYSQKYVENVCTGGIEEGTGKMVRIHPVPVRYLEPGHRFKKFQWISAKVMRHSADPRPESLRIEPNSIEVQEEIPAHHDEERRRLIEASPHISKSVEDLKDRWERDRTSLGAILPKEILDVKVVPRSAADRQEWLTKERELLNQGTLPFEQPPKPLDFPEAEFRVTWRCDDQRCSTHEMKMLQWGIHELHRNLKRKGDPRCDDKVKEKMWSELDLKKRDIFLFLGNFRGTMWNFGLMDSFSPGKRRQLAMPW
jgi:hypothetical protein